MTVKDKVTSMVLKQLLQYASGNPEKNVPKLLDWLDRFDKDGVFQGQSTAIRSALADPNNVWARFVYSLYTDLDDNVRKKLLENLLIQASIVGVKRQRDCQEKYGCNIPWAILMDPTSACNLHCTGCWAAEYGNQLNMDYKSLDKIIRQGKDLGIYMYIYSGGEPLVRKEDILTLCKVHDDCTFLAFTNATLIDEAFADAMLTVKNFIPAISVEGFEEETDSRRGKGTYQKVIRAMGVLKERRLPFGVSCCYTSQNCETIGSEAYFDDMLERGAKFAWFFTYMPVGKDAVPELMVNPEQRAFMYQQIRKFRETKPIFTMDFWNDGEYVGGCIAGGRCYLHINANGDVEPCAFIHYADSNIHETSLLDALRSPLFIAYNQGQPFNHNHLRPCPLLDNPQCLQDMVEQSGAHSTDLVAPEDVHELCGKCELAAKNWASVADHLWETCEHWEYDHSR